MDALVAYNQSISQSSFDQYFSFFFPSLKVAEHKTTFDQAIKDITGKLNSAITSLNSKIKDLHENISDRQQNTRKALDQLQQSEESEGHIKGYANNFYLLEV